MNNYVLVSHMPSSESAAVPHNCPCLSLTNKYTVSLQCVVERPGAGYKWVQHSSSHELCRQTKNPEFSEWCFPWLKSILLVLLRPWLVTGRVCCLWKPVSSFPQRLKVAFRRIRPRTEGWLISKTWKYWEVVLCILLYIMIKVGYLSWDRFKI